MLLSRKEILELVERGELVIEPYSEDVVRENGIDLKVGNEYAVYAFESQVIDPCEIDSDKARQLFSIVEAKDSRIIIPPRSFILLTTLEYIKMPNDVAGLCNLRSTLARYGLAISPTIIDVGFEGNVTIEVMNMSGNYVVLRPGMRFLHVALIKTTSPMKYTGKYLGQRGVTPPKGMKGECA